MLSSSPADLTIDELLKGDLQLTSPPQIYFKLKEVIDDPNHSLTEAAFIIEKDPALAIRLMKIVNSAFYGFPSKISSVTRAVTIIGSQELQNLVFSTVIIDRFTNLPGEIMTMHDFWAKSLKCALMSREVDHYLGDQFRESVFLGGLLHEIGQLVFFRRIPNLARDVDLQLKSKTQVSYDDEVRIEKEIIGFDHFLAGAQLCRLWKLPESIIESIRLHNYPDNTGPFFRIAAITRMAHYYGKLEVSHDEVIAKSLNIPPSEIEKIMDKVHDQFEQIFHLFYTAR